MESLGVATSAAADKYPTERAYIIENGLIGAISCLTLNKTISTVLLHTYRVSYYL